MLGDALRLHIEAFAVDARNHNALFVKATQGELTPEHLARYLVNIHQLVLHTPVHLRRARAEAARSGHVALAEHFDRRLGEEDGHDVWAERDLQRLGSDARRPQAALAEGMRDLLAFLERTIDEDPSLYLAYILFAEYLTVLMGPEWLALLEERCGIPREAMTVIGKHAELDKEHVQDALEEIDDLVADPSKLPRLRAVLDETFVLFDRFCDDVTRTPEVPHERSSSIRVTAQLSVA